MRRFNADEIECRVGVINAKGFSLLLYKTARADYTLLTEEYGDLWQNDFKVIDGKMYGGIGVFNKELNQWIWRWDCGTESNTEAEKGQASDCFKRAAFKFGSGIELYSTPFIWISAEKCPVVKNEKGRYQIADKFEKLRVKDIKYTQKGAISFLEIVNRKGETLFAFGKKSYRTNKPPAPGEIKSPVENVDADMKYIEKIPECRTVEELEALWKTDHKKVVSLESYNALCTARKRVLINAANVPAEFAKER